MAPPPTTSTNEDGRNKHVTVLIVEDDDDARESVADLLRDEGFDVLTARDGVEAMEQLSKHPRPSALVLDLSLPRLGGREVLRRVRAQQDEPRLPICVLSGERELPADVDLALSKPLLVHRLVQMQNWLRDCVA